MNHLEGHIWANFLEHGKPDPPYVALVVSGGHTMLVHMPEVHRHELLGQTLDDAAGEAFDKVARLLGLGFPGGPALDAMAAEGDPRAIRFPRAMEDSGDLDFSMSGLKTAVLRYLRAEQAAGRDVSLPGRRRARSRRRSWTCRSRRPIAAAKDTAGATRSSSAAAWSRTPGCANG